MKSTHWNFGGRLAFAFIAAFCVSGASALENPQNASTVPASTQPVAEWVPVKADPRYGMFQYNLCMWRCDAAGMLAAVHVSDNEERRLAAAMVRADGQIGRLLSSARERFGESAAESVAIAIGDRTNRALSSAHTLLLSTDGSYSLTLAIPPSGQNVRRDSLAPPPVSTLSNHLSEETLAKLTPSERQAVESALGSLAPDQSKTSGTKSIAAPQLLPAQIEVPPKLDDTSWKVTIDGREYSYKHGGQAIALILHSDGGLPSAMRLVGNEWQIDMNPLAGMSPGRPRMLIDSYLKYGNRAKVVYQELLAGVHKSADQVIARIEGIDSK